MTATGGGRAALLSAVLLALVLLGWQAATRSGPGAAAPSPEDAEYAALMGQGTKKTTGFPSPVQIGQALVGHLANPFYDRGPNDKGIGIQLGHSLARVAGGFLLAVLVALPLGFLIGTSPLLYQALNPFIQVLKPISPLAWMPIALYTIKDSSASGVFVIFICSLWPMLINTAHGVASVRKEWLNVARTLEVSTVRRAFEVMLPAAAPTILTGMRISMGIAWLVIVAAEMLVGGTGIGYFVWNEWNSLNLANVVFAILIIGLVGMALDAGFGRLQRLAAYVD